MFETMTPINNNTIFSQKANSYNESSALLRSMSINNEKYSTAQTTTSHSASCKTSKKSDTSSSWVWKVGQLHPIPMFHPIEWNTLTIDQDSIPLDTATTRISEFLRLNSIACSYNDHGRVHGTTNSFLQFVVQLWQQKSLSSNAVLVQIQRIQGDSLELQHLKRRLCHAIETGEQQAMPSNQVPRATCELLNIISSRPIETQCECDDHYPSAVDICRQLLESEQWHENRMGLETLITLTDSSKTIRREVYRASHLVLADSEFQNLWKHYLIASRSNKDSKDDGNCGRGNSGGSMHLMALQVLSHALESAVSWQHTTDRSSSVDLNMDNVFWHDVCQLLQDNVQLACCRTLEAALSTRCLRLLQTLHPRSCDQMDTRNLYKCLQSAHTHGRRCNLSLERETEQYLRGLELRSSK
jgi:hypothetical protein